MPNEEKASLAPSGDQAGKEARNTLDVTEWRPEPSAFMMWISCPEGDRATKAILRPSGDQSGLRFSTPVIECVSLSMPVPSILTM